MVKVRRGYRSKNVRVTGSTGRSRGPRIPQSRGGKAGAGIGGMGLVGVIIVLAITVLGGGGGLDLGALDLEGSGFGNGSTGGLTQDDLPEVSDADLEEWSAIFDDVQNLWIETFSAAGVDYRISTLTIFNGSTTTDGCGQSIPAHVGPFYCPADDGVYFDPAFFRELADRFGAAGDFAIAYVLAHELGHHVQNVSGVSGQVREQQEGVGQVERNALTIRLELQADCLAGVWAAEAMRRPRTLNGNDNILYLERGDLEEGLAAAAAVGDDNIQETSGVAIDADTWSHGSSAQREAWLEYGIQTGDPGRCGETFDERIPAVEIMPGG